jgi:hypothetical protein
LSVLQMQLQTYPLEPEVSFHESPLNYQNLPQNPSPLRQAPRLIFLEESSEDEDEEEEDDAEEEDEDGEDDAEAAGDTTGDT